MGSNNNIEQELFTNVNINYKSLIKYGFKIMNKKYVYTKKFLNNNFKAEIIIDENSNIIGKVYDENTNEEYSNFRIENKFGSFVSKVRDEYKKILKDIIDNCCKKKYFTSEQSNRIANYIIEKYNGTPEFLWSKFPSYGVFRNINSKKWYAIIMKIDNYKLNHKNHKEVEILNIKIDSTIIKELLKQKGFYQAYHMNSKNWITISLEDQVDDEKIFELIDNSYNNTK